jgi:hypothetical protein
MSMITFPTRLAHRGKGPQAPPGLPKRATPCACDTGPVIDHANEPCVRCGHYTQTTIDRTWTRRAEEIANRRAA